MGELHELTRGQMEHALDALADVANRMTRAVEYDNLTGLLSRERMSSVIERGVTGGKSFGVLFLDLDGFKQVNDSLGHGVGDELLKLLAWHLQNSFTRANDLLAVEVDVHAGRLAGDEFIICVDFSELGRKRVKIPQEALAITEAYLYEVIERFVEQAKSSLGVPERINLGASIGSELFDPANPKSVADILDGADRKMYEAKKRRKGAR